MTQSLLVIDDLLLMFFVAFFIKFLNL